jgi:ribosomal protein L4
VNKKEKRAAIRSLIVEKLEKNSACILKFDDKKIEKTKQIAAFLNNLGILGKRVLVLAKQSTFNNFKRCLRNIPKKALVDIRAVNGYELALCQNLIIADSILDDIDAILTIGETK